MPDPLEAVVRQEDNRLAALIVLDALTPDQRVAFVLHDGFGVPFGEIADVLSVSVASADSSRPGPDVPSPTPHRRCRTTSTPRPSPA